MIAPWLPRNPIQTFTERSPENYAAALHQFNVKEDERYRPWLKKTWCNIFVWDGTRALGCEIPHWFDPATGHPTKPFVGGEMTANMMGAWFEEFGVAHGWSRIPGPDADARGAAGFPTVAQWSNPTGGSGHVAFLVGEGQVHQAGAVNGVYDIRHVFGDRLFNCWTHA
jgi:hypothetical protein